MSWQGPRLRVCACVLVCSVTLVLGSRCWVAVPFSASWHWDSQGDPTAYLSTTKEPSGPIVLLFLLSCSYFFFTVFKNSFLKTKMNNIFLLPLWG